MSARRKPHRKSTKTARAKKKVAAKKAMAVPKVRPAATRVLCPLKDGKAPSEQALIEMTLAKLTAVAGRHNTTPRQLCRIILKDTKIYDRLRGQQGSVTLHLYGRLHQGLDNFKS